MRWMIRQVSNTLDFLSYNSETFGPLIVLGLGILVFYILLVWV